MTIIGGLVLFLLERNHTNVSFVDAYFIAVSAMCVTGISIIDFSQWYLSSQIITLILIICGGSVLVSLAPIIIRRYYYRNLYASHNFSLHQPTPYLGGKKGQIKPRLRDAISDRKMINVEDNLEYLALGELMWIVIGYYLFFNLASIFILTMYFYGSPTLNDMWESRVKAPSGLGPLWGAVFHCMSAFNNAGFSPLSDNLMYFAHDPIVLIILAVLIAAGNTAYPMFLRLFVWLCSRWRGPSKAHIYNYLMNYPRRCHSCLFPAAETWTLTAIFVAIMVVDTSAFTALEINMVALKGQSFGWVMVSRREESVRKVCVLQNA